jgi:hypothetical protein
MLVNLTPEQRQLLDLAARVPPSEVPTAKRIPEALIVDPLWLALESASVDDEELTPEAQAAIAEAEAAIERGEGIPHGEILREFGSG